MIVLSEYSVTVQHDAGKIRLHVTSSSGIKGAIDLVIKAEDCPENAIVAVRLIKTRLV